VRVVVTDEGHDPDETDQYLVTIQARDGRIQARYFSVEGFAINHVERVGVVTGSSRARYSLSLTSHQQTLRLSFISSSTLPPRRLRVGGAMELVRATNKPSWQVSIVFLTIGHCRLSRSTLPIDSPSCKAMSVKWLKL